MSCYVYIIRCKDGMYYTGITSNIRRRLNEHNLGIRSSIQSSRRPTVLVYSEKFVTRIEAAKREKEIKGWSRKKKEIIIQVYAEERKQRSGE